MTSQFDFGSMEWPGFFIVQFLARSFIIGLVCIEVSVHFDSVKY